MRSPYQDAARLRRVLALDKALDRFVAEAPDGEHLTAALLVTASNLEGWDQHCRERLARLAGLKSAPSDDTWALLCEHRAGAGVSA